MRDYVKREAQKEKQMNEITTREANRQELDSLDRNFFEQYGEQVAQRNIRGQLLKFSKGDWLAGQNDEEIPVGTKLVANMDQLLVGWIKWVENKPDQQIMGRLVEGHKPQKRDELGDSDEDLWEVDSQGKARDPWQFSNYILMKEPGSEPDNDDGLFTFTTSSRGGLNAIGELCKAFGKNMRMEPNKYPIVELGVDSYKHPNPEYGRIKVPTLKVVGWEDKEKFANIK